MTDEELLEENWGRALVHESGHALMAVPLGVPCYGIYFHKTANKFCAIADLPPESGYSDVHYLFLTASSAAELIVYGSEDEDGAKSDRLAFQNAGAPSVQDALNRSHALLLGNEHKLKRLVSKLKSKCLQVALNLANLPEIGMDGSDDRFGVLLSKAELEDAVCTE
jgi:hypothetical protein